MWNKDSARRSSMTLPRNLSPANAFSSGPRHFPPPPVSNSYDPPRRPFFRNTFSPVHGVPPIRDNSPSRVPQSSDTGLQSSFSFGKHHGFHRTGGISPLSSSEILRAPYSPGQYRPHPQNKPSVPSLEQFPKNSSDQFPKNSLEQFPKNSFKQFPQSSLEQFPKNSLEQFPKNSLEQFPQSSLEQFPQSSLEQFPQSSLEQFPQSSLEQFPQSSLEQFPKSSLEQFPKSSLEQFPKSSMQQFPKNSLEPFSNSSYIKTEVNTDKRFSFRNSPPPHQIPFLSERKNFGGIPFISDATVDSSSPYSNHGISVSSAIKQEEDSLDYCYNRRTPSDENRESTPSHSFEKGNSSHDHSGFSQKSDDSYLSEGNHCEPNVNEDSQSQSSFPVIDSPSDSSTRKARLFSEDSNPASDHSYTHSHDSICHAQIEGDSVENASKRQKLSHDLSNDSADVHRSELEKSVQEGGQVAGDSIENSPKCQQPDHDMDSDPVSVEKSELEKHITEVSEPVVGLDHLMEFKKENVPPSLYTYKCSLCNCSVLAKHVLMHILSVKHRLRYLKTIDESEHQRIMRLGTSQDELASIVAEAVVELEVKHGRGSVKVVCIPSSEVKDNEESNLEDSFSISPTVPAPSTAPPADDLLLDKIPEPPDLKLLNDILSTAHTLQSGVPKDFFQFSGRERNEVPPKEESAEFKTVTAGSKWQLGCEIPPPPPLPFTGGTSQWNRDTSCIETLPTPSAKSPCDVNPVTNEPLPPSTSCSTKTDAPPKYTSSEHEPGIFPTGFPLSSVKNKNSDARDTSSSECNDHTTSHHVVSQVDLPSNGDLKLKDDSFPERETEVLPKIPLINDTVCDTTENTRAKCINIPAVFNNVPAEGVMLSEEEEELGKAAIFEHLSQCKITNEAEASLVEKIICTMSEMYFAYKLQDLPQSESESLLQALRMGEKEGTEKLTSILYHHSTSDDILSETDGKRNSCEGHSMSLKNDFSSPVQSVKNEGSVIDAAVKLDSGPVPPSTQEVDASESVLNSLSSHNSNQLSNKSINSPSSLTDGEAKLINGNKDVADSSDARGIPVKETGNDNSEALTVSKDGENPQNLVELTFFQPPPPPPAEPPSQITVSEQSGYSQTPTSYADWSMSYYPGATQTGSYMYWPSQNMGGMDPSVMNTQYMIPNQNPETGLYSWCQQAPPPLPPPPPPPPPPPTSSAP